jgi:formate-dependent nitrite reductase membrane component NrfD
MAEQMVQVAYNAQHLIPWHWPVPAYLVTKGIAAGIFMILSLGLGFGWFDYEATTVLVAGFVSLLFLGLTTGLLVHDLEKPGRFFSIMTKPQWRSWLARGAFILAGFTVVAGIWWLVEAAAFIDLISADTAETVRPVALWIGLPLAIAVAVYTAYLLSQAEGRDLWQSSLLPFHLVIQAFLAGAGALLIIGLFLVEEAEGLYTAAWTIFIFALAVDLFVLLVGEFSIPHASEVAAKAAHDIRQGRYRNYFWWGTVVLGHIVPIVLALVSRATGGQPAVGAVAGLCAIAGLFLYEYAFVMAPQDIPNS